jgi:hypothetical protein
MISSIRFNPRYVLKYHREMIGSRDMANSRMLYSPMQERVISHGNHDELGMVLFSNSHRMTVR